MSHSHSQIMDLFRFFNARLQAYQSHYEVGLQSHEPLKCVFRTLDNLECHLSFEFDNISDGFKLVRTHWQDRIR